MNSILDPLKEIGKRICQVKNNHFFLLFFVFFIILIGTFGVWMVPVFFVDVFCWDILVDSFNPPNLLSFSVTLMSVFVFDKIISTFKSEQVLADIELRYTLMWFSMLLIASFFIVIVLFVFGFKAGTGFSWFSFIAWLIVLFIWAVGSVNNPHYKIEGLIKDSLGAGDLGVSNLRTGE